MIHNNVRIILRMTNILYSMNHCEIGSEGLFILKSNYNNNNCDVWLKGIACNCLLICDLHYWEHDGHGDRYCLAVY